VKRRSSGEPVVEQVRERATALRERIAPVADRGIRAAEEAAGTARDWAAPRVSAARDWAAPVLEKGWERGREVTAPAVGQAAERLAPAVDAARDRLVEDLLPRIVSALSAAAATVVAARAVAGDDEPDRSADPVDEPKRHRGRLVLLLAIAAAIAAAIAWRRNRRLEEWRRVGAGDEDLWTDDDLLPPAAAPLAHSEQAAADGPAGDSPGEPVGEVVVEPGTVSEAISGTAETVSPTVPVPADEDGDRPQP